MFGLMKYIVVLYEWYVIFCIVSLRQQQEKFLVGYYLIWISCILWVVLKLFVMRYFFDY